MRNRISYDISQDFLNKINNINNLNNIKKSELKQLIMIFIKLNSLFNLDDKILNLFLPYILYTNIILKDNQINQIKNLEYNISDIITIYNKI